MSKYIDADKLYKKIDEQMAKFAKLEKETESDDMDLTSSIYYGGKRKMCSDILTLIDSLHQEQSKSSKGKFVFPKFLYARTIDNKTIDVSYAPQSMDAVEYIQNGHIEQPEVDLEKEINGLDNAYFDLDGIAVVGATHYLTVEDLKDIARHFWNKGYNARKEE